ATRDAILRSSRCTSLLVRIFRCSPIPRLSLPIVNPPHNESVARLEAERAEVQILDFALDLIPAAVRQFDHVILDVIAVWGQQIQFGDTAVVERRVFVDRTVLGASRPE